MERDSYIQNERVPPDGPTPHNRRRGRDWMVKTVTWVSRAAWALVFIIFFVITCAKPAGDDFFSRLFQITPDTEWAMGLLRLAAYMMSFTFLLCVAGLIMNFRRNRRKTDRLNPSLILIGAMSLVGAVVSFVLFF